MKIFRLPSIRRVTIHREGVRVQVIENGKLILDVPWKQADEIAKGLIATARKAEEEEKAASIAFDNAILIRAGFPIGLSGRGDIVRESVKEAAWNSDIRRYLPGGIKSEAVFGTPTIIRGPSKKRTEG